MAIGFVLVGFVVGRTRGTTGVLSGTLAGWILFVGTWICMYASYYSYRDPNVVDYAGPAITLFVFSVYGLVWGAVISTSLHFIIKHTTQHISRRRLAIH